MRAVIGQLLPVKRNVLYFTLIPATAELFPSCCRYMCIKITKSLLFLAFTDTAILDLYRRLNLFVLNWPTYTEQTTQSLDL